MRMREDPKKTSAKRPQAIVKNEHLKSRKMSKCANIKLPPID